MPSREELLQIANAKASEAAVKQIANDYKANTELYYETAAKGDFESAAHCLREARRLEAEAAPYVQAAQQQQSQQQYTDAEKQLMNDYPDQVRRNWNTALAASNNLVARKRQADPEADLWAYRNSGEYISTIAHACGITDANGAESVEVASPDEALRACQSKYGEVTTDQYNSGVEKLIEMKKLGYYRPE